MQQIDKQLNQGDFPVLCVYVGGSIPNSLSQSAKFYDFARGVRRLGSLGEDETEGNEESRCLMDGLVR